LDLRILGDRQEARRDGPSRTITTESPTPGRSVDEERASMTVLHKGKSFGFYGLDLLRILYFGFQFWVGMSTSFGSTVMPGAPVAGLDDDPLARLQAVGDLPQAVVERANP